MTPGDFEQVYAELRRIAAAKLARESPGHTLDATALVHEAWLKLAGASVGWHDRTHFLRVAATAMRRVLVDRRPPPRDRPRTLLYQIRSGQVNRTVAPVPRVVK